MKDSSHLYGSGMGWMAMDAADPRKARRSRACMVRRLRSTAPKRLKMTVRGFAFIANEHSYMGHIFYVRGKFVRDAYVTKNKGQDIHEDKFLGKGATFLCNCV